MTKECKRCKKHLLLSEFNKNATASDGHQYDCRKCQKARAKSYSARPEVREQKKQYFDKFKETLKGQYTRYKSKSKYRKIDFNLSLEEFGLFWTEPCFYCGGDTKLVGIDRIDNSQGYDLNNCVSCCWDCNSKKWQISLEMCEKIVELAKKRDLL